MKKSLKMLLGVVTSFALLTSCGSTATTETSTETSEESVVETETTVEETEIVEEEAPVDEAVTMYEGEQLVLGIMPSLDNIPLLVAEEQGFYEKHGANVAVERFVSPKDRDIAYVGEQLNTVVCDLLAVATYHKSGIDTKVVTGMKSNFALVVTEQSGIENVEGLEGKSILYSKNSVIEYTIDKMLESVGLTADAVEKVEVPAIPLRVEMLAKGESDSAVLPVPYYNQAVLDGSTYITDSLTLGIDVVNVSVKNDYLASNEENVKRFLAAYDEAVEYVSAMDKSEFEAYAIEALGWSEDLQGNLGEYEFVSSYNIAEEQVTEAMAWAFEKELSDTLLTYEEVIFEN